MATQLKNLSQYKEAAIPSGKGRKIAVVVSEWNHEITFSLRDACLETLLKHGAEEHLLFLTHVPGTFELPTAADFAARTLEPDCVICIGCVIKGETRHDEYINHAVSQGLIQLTLKHEIPFIFGVLTPENLQQAKDRTGGKHGNKGTEAAITALQMIALQKETLTNLRDFNENSQK